MAQAEETRRKLKEVITVLQDEARGVLDGIRIIVLEGMSAPPYRLFCGRCTTATTVYCSEAKVSTVCVQDTVCSLLPACGNWILCSLSCEIQRSQQSHNVSVYLSCEPYYVEVCVDETGHILSVKLVQGSHQEVATPTCCGYTRPI